MANPTATFDTSLGTFTAEIYLDKMPITATNFIKLAQQGFYDGLHFHRVINGFMIQGGCPEGSGRGNPGYRFADELPAPRSYEIGSLAMANAGPDTNGSQFFIVSGPSGVGLPPSYSLFGKLISGLDVLEAIQSTPTDRSDRPQTPVVINSITITEE